MDLERYQGQVFREKVMQCYDSLKLIGNYQERLSRANALFNLTARKDAISHVHSLVFRAEHSTPPQPALFTEAFDIAKKNGNIDAMCFVEYSRSYFYIARKQYDSAMVYILSYRDLYPSDPNDEGYRNIINLLGDSYYFAGIYSKAREIYMDMYLQYAVENRWDFYRPFVIMNDLGQIAIRTNKLAEARFWFMKSLDRAVRYLNTPYRENALAYTRIKLAQTDFESGNLQSAKMWLKLVENADRTLIGEDVYQEFLYCFANLLLHEGNPLKALKVVSRLVPGDTSGFESYRFIPDAYLTLSQIYTTLGDETSALQNLRQYVHIRDSLKAMEHLSRSVVILAERNHEITKQELKQSRKQFLFLISGLVLLLIVLSVILILSNRLYKSKLALVQHSLELHSMREIPKEPLKPEVSMEITSEELDKQKKLINSLISLMENEKVYLSSSTTIQDVAKRLSTNRTYLSRAINHQLQTSFPTFINELRIREAIRLITTGYMQNYTQESLAAQCGFANRTVFISAFKKNTGVVPSFFIANYMKMKQSEA